MPPCPNCLSIQYFSSKTWPISLSIIIPFYFNIIRLPHFSWVFTRPPTMKFYCGIDLSARDSSLCVIDESLSIILRQKVRNELPRIISCSSAVDYDYESCCPQRLTGSTPVVMIGKQLSPSFLLSLCP